MNVFKFHISLRAKDSISSIPGKVQEIFASKSIHGSKYTEKVKEKWSQERGDQIRALYPPEAVLVYGDINKCTYYLIESNANNSIVHTTLQVFVKSELDNINQAFEVVYKELRAMLKKDFRIEIVEPKVLFYIYSDGDICTPDILINADLIKYSKPTRLEVIRYAILGILTVLFVIIFLISSDGQIDNIMYSLVGSCIFFIVSELLIKFRLTYTLSITDFENLFEKDQPYQTVESSDGQLTNPPC